MKEYEICLNNLKKSFKDYSLLAIVLTINNEKLWKLIDYDLIETYKHIQFSLFKNKKSYFAEDFDFKSVYIFDIENNKDLITSLDNLSSYKEYKLLANRSRIQSKSVWKLVDKGLQNKYIDTLISLKYQDNYFNAFDYRNGVVALKNKFSKEIILVHCKSKKIAMKI